MDGHSEFYSRRVKSSILSASGLWLGARLPGNYPRGGKDTGDFRELECESPVLEELDGVGVELLSLGRYMKQVRPRSGIWMIIGEGEGCTSHACFLRGHTCDPSSSLETKRRSLKWAKPPTSNAEILPA
jgi:hypothetical protein